MGKRLRMLQLGSLKMETKFFVMGILQDQEKVAWAKTSTTGIADKQTIEIAESETCKG